MTQFGAALIIAKAPEPGRAKTRLAPVFGLDGAAELAAAALADTIAAVRAIPARRHVLVLDGPLGPWAPPGLEVIPQASGGLLAGVPGDRAEACLAALRAVGVESAVVGRVAAGPAGLRLAG